LDEEQVMGTTFGSRTASLLSLALLLGAVASGCASNEPQENGAPQATADNNENDDFEPTVVAQRDYSDPLIGINRAIFAFNEVSYRYLLFPLGKGYTNVTPEPVQQGISNFFYNLKAPIYVVNNALQLKPRDAGTNVLRFGINTTIGLLGLFDPATHWFGIEKVDTSFEETLMQYGVGYGFYVVIPFLGPADLRSGTSVLVEGIFHPVTYIADDRDRLLIQGFDYFQEFAPQVETFEALLKESEDPYIFMRNFYLQGIERDAQYPDDSGSEDEE